MKVEIVKGGGGTYWLLYDQLNFLAVLGKWMVHGCCMHISVLVILGIVCIYNLVRRKK